MSPRAELIEHAAISSSGQLAARWSASRDWSTVETLIASDRDLGDAELRARLLSTVLETQLREDQSDLANWTRGDRKARFEQTAERHAGLNQFAAPFLSRMKFVDEQGEGTSPTLAALRVYREHRAAGRRGVPARRTARFRTGGAAAAHPRGRRDGPPPLGERVVPQRCATRSRPATSPSTARRTSAGSRRSSGYRPDPCGNTR